MRALLLLLAGCDAVLGLDGDPPPCGADSFAGATATDLSPADAFSISRDESLIVLAIGGRPYQLRPGGAPVAIELGAYVPAQLSLAPDASALYYTAAIEPPALFGAVRDGDAWQLDAIVPRVTYAGTPSAGEYGPRRLLAKLTDTAQAAQEYEDDAGAWLPHGDPLPVPGVFAPNLTPTGLTMVFAAPDGVYLASRASLDAAFDPPALILPGAHAAPQLLDSCRALYAIDLTEDHASTLRRYRR